MSADTKRGAAGMSPEALKLQDALAAGVRAGEMGHGASMNPYPDGTPEYHEWDRGRLAAIGQSLARRVA